MTDQPAPQEITDLEALRLLAHPMRYRIQRQLQRGPVTATSLARALGESTGLTSYHLRQLARHGFIEEVPELAHGRERWWRSVPRDLRVPPRSRQSTEMRAVIDEVNRLDAAADLEQFARFQLERDAMGEWGDALLFSRGSIRVTLDELRAFFEDYIKLLYRYNRADTDTSPGVRTVLTRFFAFPAIDPPDAGPGSSEDEPDHEPD